MTLPEGYSKAGPCQYYKLKRSLYGLKQANRQWKHELTTQLSQRKYILDIVNDMKLNEVKHAPTPLVSDWSSYDPNSPMFHDPSQYRRLVGRLLYLDFTRLDVTYYVHLLSQFLQQPIVSQWNVVLHVVKYLKGTANYGLFYSANTDLQLQAYCDSDWAKCPHTRRSTSGYCITIGGSLVSRKSKKQHTIAKSSNEAEYRSAASTVCEIKWLVYVLKDFGVSVSQLVPLFCDNKSVITMIENPVFHERTKHIAFDCHFIRDHFKVGFIKPHYILSRQQLADVFTKPLPAYLLADLLSKIHFSSVNAS
ncbi:transmembrane signal receptor [Lithospermum erythrorhizon]|uniref:Transmembrane signal receptor n=1 Tax=Lithospermum erythrorhizon TaxID=34254 RepID=A0AAV3RQN0_LITER